MAQRVLLLVTASLSFCCCCVAMSTNNNSNKHNSFHSNQRNAGGDVNGSCRKPLPGTVLMGYGSDCDKVRLAILNNGVNVVVWSFIDIVSERDGHESRRDDDDDDDKSEHGQDEKANRDDVLQNPADPKSGRTTRVSTSLDLKAIRDLKEELSAVGHGDVVHLVGFGGWNGPHLDPSLSASEWFSAFRYHVGDLFDGIDWDFEGNDDLKSPYNVFTVECLDKMGNISRMAKNDGYIVSVAPPQSYLDVLGGNDRFSRSVNLTDPTREWHGDFHYFGTNVYAHLLFKYGDAVDLVSLQLYESYSRAAMAVYHAGVKPSEYLIQSLRGLADHRESYYVDFSEDPAVGIDGRRNVSVPLSKLVIGLANGWADDGGDKTLYIAPDEIETCWKALILAERKEGNRRRLLPRGFMFWTINEEGRDGVYLARGLKRVLFGDYNTSKE